MKTISALCLAVLWCLPVSQMTAQGTASGQASDRRDLVTREWITDLQTNVRFLDHETVYDAQGRKVEETEYNRLGKLWTKRYEYFDNGKVSKELTYNPKGRLDSVQKFEYDQAGKKQAIYTYDAKGRMVKMKVVEYKAREHEKD